MKGDLVGVIAGPSESGCLARESPALAWARLLHCSPSPERACTALRRRDPLQVGRGAGGISVWRATWPHYERTARHSPSYAELASHGDRARNALSPPAVVLDFA